TPPGSPTPAPPTSNNAGGCDVSTRGGCAAGAIGRPSAALRSSTRGNTPMVRKLFRASLFAALGLAVVTLSGRVAVSADDKKDKDDLPNISEIMKKAHAKTDGYLAKLGGAAKDGKWEDAQRYAKDLGLAADALAKNKP